MHRQHRASTRLESVRGSWRRSLDTSLSPRRRTRDPLTLLEKCSPEDFRCKSWNFAPRGSLLFVAFALTLSMLSRRRALVVGINEYSKTPLRCCVNDATDMHAALQRMNFESTLLVNPDFHALMQATPGRHRLLLLCGAWRQAGVYLVQLAHRSRYARSPGRPASVRDRRS